MVYKSKFFPAQHFIKILILFFSGIVSAAAPRVYIESPENGALVQSPVEIVFALDGMELAPAGTYATDTGHHHLIIDNELPDLGMPIPSDNNHLHFGKAQDRVLLDLEPGLHTLQLLLGDGSHIPHQPPLISEKIEIRIVP
tara:strand:- start:454 stop:876 length:423 start_codon:yes stop_codon:yes gene_type:complete